MNVTMHKPATGGNFDIVAQAVDAAGNPVPFAGPVTWTNSNPAVCTIGSDANHPANGTILVSGIHAGTTNLTATDGVLTATVTLIIDPGPEADIVFSTIP